MNIKKILIGGAIVGLVLIAIFIGLFLSNRNIESDADILQKAGVNLNQDGSKIINPQGVTTTNNLYTNEAANIEFSFYDTWGPVQTINRESGKEQIDSGSLKEIHFTNNEGVFIEAYTPDLKGMYVDRGFSESNMARFCKNYKPTAGNFVDCRVIKRGSIEYAWANELVAPECSPDFRTAIYAYNPYGKFHNIKILIRLKGVEIPYDCTKENGGPQAIPKAKIISQSIFDGKSLSEENYNELAKLDIILNNLKFTK